MNLRRLRQNSHIRELVRENRVSHEQMIQPLFVVEGLKSPESIMGLKGVNRDTPKTILKQIEADLKKGVSKFLLFGVPTNKSTKDFKYDFTSKQIKEIKKTFGNSIWLSVDVCLCSYTSHGHCGILNHEGDHLINESTVAELARAATDYAIAGADCVAPSDMMDGRISAIRSSLDHKSLHRTLIMSYAAKFHSKFYGPFRLAADSAPKGNMHLKNRATYQIDPSNANDAILCAERDSAEGADILMVKPGLPYLDILYRCSQKILKPWAVYEVSGEYASIEILAEKGLMDANQAHLEAWNSFVRAGAKMIISYGARNAKNIISKSEF